MSVENKKQPLAEQESYALSITNKNYYTESTNFMVNLHHSIYKFQSVLLGVTYPSRWFFLHYIDDSQQIPQEKIIEFQKILKEAEDEALQLASKCAEIRRKINGKEAQNV